jgi:hypothetical protein
MNDRGMTRFVDSVHEKQIQVVREGSGRKKGEGSSHSRAVDQVLVDLVPFGINKGMGMYPFGIRSWASRCFWSHVSESGGGRSPVAFIQARYSK